MEKRIARKNWAAFAADFTAANVYRPARLIIHSEDENRAEYGRVMPFIGISISKHGKAPDNFELLAKQYDPEELAEQLVSVKRPVKIVLGRGEAESDSRLTIENDQGTIVEIELGGEAGIDHFRTAVQQTAYCLFCRRGETAGHEHDDWLEAEKRLRMVEFQHDS